MKSLVLAEKPSVGRELARVLKVPSMGKYNENDSYIVTWALGHLVTLCPPDWYGDKYKRWSLNTLPILPEELETMVIPQTAEQFELVKSLLNREDVSEVIIATDAGREGELVARWILKQSGCNKPFKRLWISSQTETAIKKGFETLKDGHDYDPLFFAGQSRSYADWYVGYNVSRAMTCHFDTRLSAGRVQTPTLALITKREEEIENFQGQFYWTLKADFGAFKASWYAKDSYTVRIPTENEANELYDKLNGKIGTIVKLSGTPHSEKPPLAYDLTELQRDANNILGLSAKDTLDTVQRLYEIHKIITYPRTDSRYVTSDIVATIGERLYALMDTPFSTSALEFAKNGIREDLSRFVNDEMVSDHHALLPTEQKVNLNKLNNTEKAVWALIIKRFLEVLSADYEYKTTTLEAEVEGERFLARVTIPVSFGWKKISESINADLSLKTKTKNLEGSTAESENEEGIMTLEENMNVKINSLELKRNNTTPPERYTEADLLYAMEHAGKFVEDEELKKNLKNGLGTPATRADIIEKLIQNNCMIRQDGYLYPTKKGRELVRLVPEQLKSPELTGKWEERLYQISQASENTDSFIKDIKQNTVTLIEQVKQNNDSFDPNLMGNSEIPCPYCKWPMVTIIDDNKLKHHVCQRFSCGFEEAEVPQKNETEEKRTITVSTVTDGDAKKRIIIKRKNSESSQVNHDLKVHEIKFETIKPSHYRPFNSFNHSNINRLNNNEKFSHDKDKNKNKTHKEKTIIDMAFDAIRKNKNNKSIKSSYTSSNDSNIESGGTFADFLRASEERKRKDEEKKKKN